MQSKAKTVDDYLKSLPDDRRKALEALRQVIRKNLDKNYEEGMQYGMIGYYVPHRVYPDGYHCDPKQPLPFASIASQKNHMAIYLMCIYGDEQQQKWFSEAWARSGKKKPDMGKSCIRFKKLEDVPLEVIGEAIRRVPAREFIEHYQSAIKTGGKRKAGTSDAKKKTTARKGTSKKTSKKKKSVGKSVGTRVSRKKSSTRKISKKKTTTANRKKKTKRH